MFSPLRCAGLGQSRSRATWLPSGYPHPSQATFAPSVRSCCLSSAGRASRPGATARLRPALTRDLFDWSKREADLNAEFGRNRAQE